jgi:hypothetical protein
MDVREAADLIEDGVRSGVVRVLDELPIYKRYRRRQIAELRPYVPGESLAGVSISGVDAVAGSPKVGDMIARNPQNHADRWLVAEAYFAENFAEMD